MKKEDVTPQDWMNISRSMAMKYDTHPVYPQLDDYVQESMVAMESFGKDKPPLSTIYYSHLRTKYRIQDKRLGISRKQLNNKKDVGSLVNKHSIEQMHEMIPNKQLNINDKIAVNDFMNWLPTERQRYIFDRLLEGYDQSEIGKQMGITRAYVSLIKLNTISQYKIVIKK